MPTTTALLSAEEFLLLPGDEPCDLVRGEIRPMTRGTWTHTRVARNAFLLLHAFVAPRRLGECVPDNAGFRLTTAGATRGTVRSPDAAFIRAERVPSIPPSGWIPGAPDLAVEVLSPSDGASELQEKLDDYFAAGTSAVWVIDTRRRTVEAHTPDAPVRRLREGDALDGASVLPDFRCAVAELFEGLGGGNAERAGA
jgi:Uma2 family endonuclease